MKRPRGKWHQLFSFCGSVEALIAHLNKHALISVHSKLLNVGYHCGITFQNCKRDDNFGLQEHRVQFYYLDSQVWNRCVWLTVCCCVVMFHCITKLMPNRLKPFWAKSLQIVKPNLWKKWKIHKKNRYKRKRWNTELRVVGSKLPTLFILVSQILLKWSGCEDYDLPLLSGHLQASLIFPWVISFGFEWFWEENSTRWGQLKNQVSQNFPSLLWILSVMFSNKWGSPKSLQTVKSWSLFFLFYAKKGKKSTCWRRGERQIQYKNNKLFPFNLSFSGN